MKDKNALHTRYADLLNDNETVDPALEQLITDLQEIYTSARRPANLSDLLTSTLDAHIEQNDSSSTIQLSEQPSAQFPYKRRPEGLKSWQRGLNAVAAIVLAALIGGSLLLVLNRTGESSQPGSGKHRVTGLNSFLSLHMINETTGWATQISSPQVSTFAVLYTTDGGINWQDVTPPQLTKSFNIHANNLYVLDANTAWLTDALDPQATTDDPVLLRTTDRGKTWQQMTIPQSEAVSQLTFLNAETGWINRKNLPTHIYDGTIPFQIDLWHTNNGGQTWSKVNTTLPDTSQVISPSDYSITFVDEKTWLLAGKLATNDGTPVIYVTHDAGLTWQQKVTSSSQTSPNLQTVPNMEQLQFFSASDGILVIDEEQPAVFVTHDGGNTWSFISSAPRDPLAFSPRLPLFTDMSHGWMAEQTQPMGDKFSVTNRLIVTSDGGQDWTTIDAQIPGLMGYSPDFDFVSATVGWLRLDSRRSTSQLLPETELFQTLDGGYTWHAIHSSVYRDS